MDDATGNIDIIPMVSAVHANPIYCCCATKNSKWLFTGSEDGFIRKYDLFSSLNGATSLTGVQKQGLADSIQKGGSIVSAWENEDNPVITAVKKEGVAGSNPSTLPSSVPADTPSSTLPLPEATKTSPVYSLDVQAEGVWLVGGTESGSINLWTLRHEEGKVQHVFRGGHKSPVSVLKISPGGDKTIMSGSWDKSLRLWSLETGAQITVYPPADHPDGNGVLSSHLTSLSITPSCPSMYLCSTYDGSVYAFDTRKKEGLVFKILPQASQAPPWTLSACWGGGGQSSHDKIFVGRRNGCVDEFDVKMTSTLHGAAIHSRTFRMPHGSGSVYVVESLPNNRHLLVGSYDNIRLWDLEHQAIESSLASNTLKDQEQDEEVGGGLDLMRDSMMEGGIEEDAFDMGLFGNQNVITKQGGKKGNDEMMLLDQDLLVPSVPFTIVPGHHGGVLSSLLLTGNCLVSTSGNKGYDGNSNNLCLLYDVQKSQPQSQTVNTSS